MFMDMSGDVVTTSSQTACLAWDQVIEGVLSHDAMTPDHLAATLAADPHFALAHAAKGLMLMSLARRELLHVAQQSLADAQAAATMHPVTDRETAYVEALGLWLSGAPRKAARRLDCALVDHPFDALAIKFTQIIRFMCGEQDAMLSSLEHIAPKYGEIRPLSGYVMGCYAFALEEKRFYREAERAGHRAVELAPRDVWGRHAVAHVLEMTGKAQEGEDWLGDAGAWAHANNMRFHIAWHVALFMLERGAFAQALELYDTSIRAEKTNDYRDIANASSLLAQLEFRGVDVGDRWHELADLGQTRMFDQQLVFADLHYALALLGAGRRNDVEAIGLRLLDDGASAPGCEQTETAKQGALVTFGLLALRERRYFEAARLLERARGSLTCIGGSNAQRDLFEQAYIESLIGCGAHERAASILRERNAARGGVNLYASLRLAKITKARAIQSTFVARQAAVHA